MGRLIVRAFSLVAASAIVSAQGPVTPPTAGAPPGKAGNLKSNEVAVVITGCISGTRLKLAAGSHAQLPVQLLDASEFVLKGPRELIDQIQRQHDGHGDEIAGVATRPPPPGGGTTDIETKQVGKRTRIMVGERPASSIVPEPPRPIHLRVQALTHVSDKCVTRR